MRKFFRSFRTFARYVAFAAVVCLARVESQADDYTCITNNGALTIKKYTGAGGAVTVPTSIAGLPVTRIGDFAFDSCQSLSSIVIPDSVTGVGSYAFQKCENLTNATIGSSVIMIDDWTFYACTSLRAVTIPNSIRSIGIAAFYKCGSLESVIIPERVSRIDSLAFASCTNLMSVNMGAGVGVIGSLAFSACTSLTNIMIPNSATNIGGNLFRACTNLTSIGVDADNPAYSSQGGVLFDKGIKMLLQCPAGRAGSFVIPNTVTNIGLHAFDHCRTLNAVIVPESVTTIGAAAFYSCTGLTGVFFAGNAPGDVATDAFDGTTNAIVYYLPGTGDWSATFGGCPTAPWYLPQPAILTVTSDFGVQANRFGFRISWATNASVLVESSAKLESSAWAPVSTNTLVNGWTDFRDPESANSPARFYRVRSQ